MRKAFVVILCCLSFFAANVQASSGGGGGKEEMLYAKLGSFTVNLQNIDEYLQIEISVKLANVGTFDAVKTNLPFIKHEIILLLSVQDSKQLASRTGKQKLIEQIKKTTNDVLKLEPANGVTEVLLGSFVIQ